MSDHNVISVSGGKDSTALLLLAIEREPENMQAVFADTGNEHPQTYDYVHYLSDWLTARGRPAIRWVKADFKEDIERKRRFVESKWRESGVAEEIVAAALEVLKPTGNPFLDLCIQKGLFPSTKARFCSEELKQVPIQEQVNLPLLDAGDDVVSWQGVRADESINRRHLPELEEKRTWPNGATLWNYRPILKWTAEDAFAMHRKHGIKHNPLYEQGMGRVGCMPCIHERKDILLEISKRFPEEIERIARWERIVAQASKLGMATFFPSVQTDPLKGKEINLENHGVWQVVEWSKTSRGGVQFDFLRSNNDNLPLCSSIYGLCE